MMRMLWTYRARRDWDKPVPDSTISQAVSESDSISHFMGESIVSIDKSSWCFGRILALDI